jgi:hypothetical protein
MPSIKKKLLGFTVKIFSTCSWNAMAIMPVKVENIALAVRYFCNLFMLFKFWY